MITLVIPAFNEEDAIARTVESAKGVLATIDAANTEVIVVDDGSSDATAARAEAAGARVIRHPANAGYGRALKSGIAAAGNETVAIIDADLTYPIEELPGLLAEYNRGFDMVVAQRTGAHYRESVLKQPLRFILRALVNFTAGQHIADVNSGLRIFNRDTALSYFRHLCDTFSFTTSQTLAYAMTGRFIAHVPVTYNKRVGRSKVVLFRDSLRTLQYIVQACVYYNPLKIFLLVSGMSFCLAIALFIAGMMTQYTTAFQLATGCVLLTLVFFCFGLIAVLLKQIMDGPPPPSRQYDVPVGAGASDQRRLELLDTPPASQANVTKL